MVRLNGGMRAVTVALLAVVGIASGDAIDYDHPARAAEPPTPVLAERAAATPNPSCSNTPPSVPNGDFEAGALAPWKSNHYGNGTLAIVAGGYNGSAHALRADVNGSSYASISQHIPSCQAHAYIISVAYRVLQSSGDCELGMGARLDRFHQLSRNFPLPTTTTPTGWNRQYIEYTDDLVGGYRLTVAVECSTTTGPAAATVLLDDVQVVDGGRTAAQGCPKTVSLVNGGFDSGQLAPWAPSPSNTPTKHELVPQGYKGSPQALEIDFPARHNPEWTIEQNVTTPLCDGYYYNITFAVNWLNYTGSFTGTTSACSVIIEANGCHVLKTSPNDFGASPIPGWMPHTFLCQAFTNLKTTLAANIICRSQTQIPAFAVRLDAFSFAIDMAMSKRDIAGLDSG